MPTLQKPPKKPVDPNPQLSEGINKLRSYFPFKQLDEKKA